MSASEPGTRQGALVLAAGSGERFGADKRLASLPDGRHVLCATLASIAEAFDDWRLVLRAGRDENLPATFAIDPARVILSAHAARGMGAALADAVREAPPEWDMLWVALADMPWIVTSTLLALQASAERSRATRIVRPRYRGHAGHPVGFPGSFRDELAALDGDAGARELLRRHGTQLLTIDVDDPAVLGDVDRLEDLTRGSVTIGNET